MKNQEIFINNNMSGNHIEIWLREYKNGKEYNIQPDFSGVNKPVEIKPGELQQKEIRPLAMIQRQFSQDFFNAVAEYTDRNGIKSPDHNLIEGKLKATEAHLADMQKAFNVLLVQIEKI